MGPAVPQAFARCEGEGRRPRRPLALSLRIAEDRDPPARAPRRRLEGILHPPPSTFHLQPSSRRAFTLLELLIVMTIMIFITTIALMNIMGGTRSSSYSGGANDVFDGLMLCHQHACLDGTKTFMLMRDSTNFVLVRDMGTVYDVDTSSGTRLVDKYSDFGSMSILTGFRLVDMDRNAYGDVTAISSSTSYGMANALTNWSMLVYYITITPSGPDSWQAGDAYGIELHADQMLPKGFQFQLGAAVGSPAPDLSLKRGRITFNTDGTISCDWSPSGGPWTLSVVEDIRSTMLTNRVKIGISPNGTIQRGS